MVRLQATQGQAMVQEIFEESAAVLEEVPTHQDSEGKVPVSCSSSPTYLQSEGIEKLKSDLRQSQEKVKSLEEELNKLVINENSFQGDNA